MGDEIDLALRLGRLNLRVSTSDPLGFPSGQPAAPNSPVGSEGSFVLVRSSSEPEAASEEPPAAAGPSALTLTLSFRDPNSASTPLGEGLNRSSASEPLAGPPAPCSSRAAHSRVARPRVIIGSCAPALPEPAAHRPDREPSDPSQASGPRAGPELPVLPDPWAEPPLHLLDTGRNLLGDGRARISRAWRAGCWAREVLEGRLNYPNSTPALSPPLRNRFYCIARGLPGQVPAVHSTFAAFRAQVGRLEDGDTITHGFASEQEARAYFAATGLPYPGLR